MDQIAVLLSDPAAWAALVTLVVMEVVLGIDNLIFISILSNKLPEEQRQKARRIGIGLALMLGQLVGQDRDEDEVVDAEHDLHHHQGHERGPGRGIVEKRCNSVHAQGP